MGFKCPLCNKDFKNNKGEFEKHIKQCNNGAAGYFVNAVRKTCENKKNNHISTKEPTGVNHKRGHFDHNSN